MKRAFRDGCYRINFCGDFNKLCLNILHLTDKREASVMRRERRHLGEDVGKGCPRILTLGESESWRRRKRPPRFSKCRGERGLKQSNSKWNGESVPLICR